MENKQQKETISEEQFAALNEEINEEIEQLDQ